MMQSSPNKNSPATGFRNVSDRILRLLRLPELFLCTLLAIFFAGKFVLMRKAATDSFAIALIQHDAAILAALLFLYAFNLYFRKNSKLRYLATTARALCILIILIYIIDILAYFFFATRLYISDAVTFSGEMDSFETLLRTGFNIVTAKQGWIVVIAAIGVGAVVYFSFVFVSGRSNARLSPLPILSVGGMLAAFYLVHLPAYVYAFGDKPLFENFAERNASFFKKTTFSDDLRRTLRSTSAPTTCHPGSNKPLDVLVVVVESLSAYHSRYFSGIEDWTPQLDAIAQNETALTNFHANGWTTIGGLVSLLTGTFPFVPEQAKLNAWGSPRLDDFIDIPEPLPRNLTKLDYQTTFVGAGDLGFLGQAEWLQAIGYQRIIDNRDPRLDKQTIRGPFNSVPDKQLFDLVLDEIAHMKGTGRHFITAQTFWSHRPFMAPDGSSHHSEEYVMRTTDQAIGYLYDGLLRMGFLDHGILFIAGDHRAMEPYRKAEIDRFGATAVTRIPAIVATKAVNLPHVIAGNFQQRDLQASLMALIDKEYCLDAYQGMFLGPHPAPPQCIMHARGDDRDLILVKCSDKEGVVAVAGDATAVASGTLPNEVALIETINRNRLRLPVKNTDLLANHQANAAR
ncbi:LTA synthase family protein [Brucella anthropi]|uniref:LTA synthase family protein n=1 Tax=Brucella anthropi TaxID=529 RepID=UPI000AF08340|nr:sulfatase-like hydrolase/transferase [Brucella anthropi]